jgi:MFS transporter, DHA2 family, methylenomycin A resistance protein
LAAALIEGGRLGWNNIWVIAAFGTAAILAMLFIIQERSARHPMRRFRFSRTTSLRGQR